MIKKVRNTFWMQAVLFAGAFVLYLTFPLQSRAVARPCGHVPDAAAAEDSEAAGALSIGDSFPRIEVHTTEGSVTLPDNYEGQWFVLFAHPADFTPVCTTEFVTFQNQYEQFRQLNCELIGLSMDQIFSHIEWLKWISDNMGVDIEFPVISDTGDISRRLGLLHTGAGDNTVRGVIVVDDEGLVRSISYYPPELGRNVDEILRSVRGMQVADNHGVALPANWPNNDMLGDRAIIPPAEDIESAQQRLEKSQAGEFQSFAWWFCHMELEDE